MADTFDELEIVDRIFDGVKHWSIDFWTEPLAFQDFVKSGEHMKNVKLAPRQLTAVTEFLGSDPITIFAKSNPRKNLAVLAWGKGSGKNMVGTLVQTYLFYILLCMRNPLQYFGFPEGESIDMVNVAANATQAKRNFFDKFTRRVKNWKWLRENFSISQHGRPVFDPENARGHIKITEDSVESDAGIKCISAHSDSKGYEGYSVIFFVMDEASSWETEYVQVEGGEQVAVSKAHTIFDTLRTSAISRSWKWGGLVISYPRQEDDFTLNLAIEIQEGKKEGYADIAATWEVKPMHLWNDPTTFEHKVERPWGTKLIYPPKDFETEFRDYPQQSELKYACIPARTKAYFIYNNQKIYDCAKELPPIIILKKLDIVAQTPQTSKQTKYLGYDILDIKEPNPEYDYYCHIDFAVSSDTAVMGIGHGEPYTAEVTLPTEDGDTQRQMLTQKVVIDQIIEWAPDNQHLVSSLNVDEVLAKLDAKLKFRYIQADNWQCWAAGTLISTQRGLVPIERVCIGDVVQSRLGSRQVTNTFSYAKKPTLRVMTSEGSMLEATPHHRIEVWRCSPELEKYKLKAPSKMLLRGHWEWVCFSDLREGDIIHYQESPVDFEYTNASLDFGWDQDRKRNLHDNSPLANWQAPEFMTPELAEFLGLIWGDGNISLSESNKGVTLTLTADEYKDASGVFTRLFGFTPKFLAHRNRNCGRMVINSADLVRWLAGNNLVKPRIPMAVLCSSRSVKAAFLRGLFATDGGVCKNTGRVSLYSSTRDLVDEVQTLLRTDFGIKSGVTTVRRGKKGDYVPTGECYVLGLRGARSEFLDKIGFTYCRKAEILSSHSHRPGRKLTVRVVSIEPGLSDVYDLEIMGDPSYVANGVISHNSQGFIERVSRKGAKAGQHNVNNKDYFLLRALIHAGAIVYPKSDILITELEKLIWNGKRVEHTIAAGKDRADCLAGLSMAILSQLGEKRQKFNFHFVA